MAINWREALARASILGGLAFFGSLLAVGTDVLLANPVRVIVPAGIAFGIAFLAVLKSVTEPPAVTIP